MNLNVAGAGESVILHLGLGSFHRAHEAVYLHRLRCAGDSGWSLVGGNIRNDMAEVVVALRMQQGRYTLETVSPAGERRYEAIRSIREVVEFDASLARLIEVGANSSTRIISFTVTESGYYLNTRGALDAGHADLRRDLEGDSCQTIYGALAAILGERLARSAAPVTLLSCDNLRHNGDRFRAGFLEFLGHRGLSALRAWVASRTTSPNSMVDRITPRPNGAVAARVKAATGVADEVAVMSEAFCQWVIEDRFAAGRPDWEVVGVEMVASVDKHEEAKIRLLNATHSCIAWAGTLRGLTYIHESIGEPAIRQMAFDYMTRDAIPCLTRTEGSAPIDLCAYRDLVLDRFSNPHLGDTNQRVASDSYAKIAGFILPTIRDCLSRGDDFASAAMLPALFFEFLGRVRRGELPYDYQDAEMEPGTLASLFADSDPIRRFCRESRLWGALADSERLVSAIRAAHRRVLDFARYDHADRASS